MAKKTNQRINESTKNKKNEELIAKGKKQMNKKEQSYKIILSGGGTGGHIYPAIAIANELKKRYPKSEFLFVGAKDRMEMEKVPQAGGCFLISRPEFTMKHVRSQASRQPRYGFAFV